MSESQHSEFLAFNPHNQTISTMKMNSVATAEAVVRNENPKAARVSMVIVNVTKIGWKS